MIIWLEAKGKKMYLHTREVGMGEKNFVHNVRCHVQGYMKGMKRTNRRRREAFGSALYTASEQFTIAPINWPNLRSSR